MKDIFPPVYSSPEILAEDSPFFHTSSFSDGYSCTKVKERK